jgi:hypothetical protein
MGSPYLSRLGLGRTWKGAGVVVGDSLIDLQVEEGGRVALGGLMNVGS